MSVSSIHGSPLTLYGPGVSRIGGQTSLARSLTIADPVRDRSELSRMAEDLTDLRATLKSLRALPSRSGGRLTVASSFTLGLSESVAGIARSTTSIGLGSTDAIAAELTSSEEVDGTAAGTTSWSPTQPGWERNGGSGVGQSTSALTLSGEYDGSLGRTSLRVRTTSAITTVNSTPKALSLDVGGNTVDVMVAAGVAVDLGHGLSVAFAAGRIRANEFFDIDVTIDPGAPDPDLPFDGSMGDPGIEDGLSIVNGSFTINGESISVSTSDSLNDVLARIDASNAGVSATWDADAEIVRLVQRTSGASHDIVFGSDTSGFLVAAKLVDAPVTPGVDSLSHYDEVVMAEVPTLAGVAQGRFTIDGVGFDVDPATDTIADILARIEEADLGVEASYDAQTDKITLSSDGEFTIEDEGSGILDAFAITAGTYGSADGFIDSPLSEIPGFSSIRAGTLGVGDAAITIDPAVDTLADVIGRLNAGTSGMWATYGRDDDRLLLRFDRSTTLDDGDTGFFSALGVAPGEYEVRGNGTNGFADRDEVRDLLGELTRGMNSLMSRHFGGAGGTELSALRSTVGERLRKTFAPIVGDDDADGVQLRSRLGLDASFAAGTELFELDKRDLDRALRPGKHELFDFLLGDEKGEDDDGLVLQLDRALSNAAARIERRLASMPTTGLLVDSFG